MDVKSKSAVEEQQEHGRINSVVYVYSLVPSHKASFQSVCSLSLRSLALYVSFCLSLYKRALVVAVTTTAAANGGKNLKKTQAPTFPTLKLTATGASTFHIVVVVSTHFYVTCFRPLPPSLSTSSSFLILTHFSYISLHTFTYRSSTLFF